MSCAPPLSPDQFARLQEYALYSTKKLADMLVEFREPGGAFCAYVDVDEQTINYEGFRLFLNAYFDVAELPLDLTEQLYLSFVRPASTSTTARRLIPPATTNAIAMVSNDRRPSAFDTVTSNMRSALHGKMNLLHDRLLPRTRSSGVESARGSLTCDTSPIAVTDSIVTNQHPRIPLRSIICYLSLIEGDCPPDQKLEFVFRLYDSDDNGYLDNKEMEHIIEQMMSVARYLQWDTIELETILRSMMAEIDYDMDGTVSLDEWKRGGLTTIPLLVLLGFDMETKEDGAHIWHLKRFAKPAYCNICLTLLVGWGGKQGLSCCLCKYTVHERCVHKAPNNCISTYAKSRRHRQPSTSDCTTMLHHWVEGNCSGRCDRCHRSISQFQGKHCRWCQTTVHSKCASQLPVECNLGALAYHIVPPTHICPAVLDRSTTLQHKQSSNSMESTVGITAASSHLQIISRPSSHHHRPLLVFVNPKSGGHQGDRLYRKFQYLLNPRQVYNLSKCSPIEGLRLFASAPDVNVLVCGGDGTVGWVLESMDVYIASFLFSDKINYDLNNRPPVVVLPLGTGNDLARCLRWGGGYENEKLTTILDQIEHATPIMIDRWQITIKTSDELDADAADSPPFNIINNYFSIGVWYFLQITQPKIAHTVTHSTAPRSSIERFIRSFIDASIARRFHIMREKYPQKFNSRIRNKFWYFEMGTTETLAATCKNLHESIEILCDGESLNLDVGPTLEGIALLNIPSIYGGSNLWGTRRRKQPNGTRWQLPLLVPQLANSAHSTVATPTYIQDMGDRLIEVVGLESAMQVGQIKAGVKAAARRLSQCSSVVIRTHRRFPMQIDGEPWMQPPCTIEISHKNQVPMLIAPNRKNRSLFDLFRGRKQRTNR